MKINVEIESLGVDSCGDIYFKIKSQVGVAQHSFFQALNGIKIHSENHPAWYAEDERLFLRGSETEFDEAILRATKEEFRKIEAALAEFNSAEARDTKARLVNTVKRMGDIISDYQKRFQEVTPFPGSIMKLKVDFITHIMYALPLSGSQCPYCEVYSCSECPFAKKHGKCDMEVESLYKTIQDAKNKFIHAIYEMGK